MAYSDSSRAAGFAYVVAFGNCNEYGFGFCRSYEDLPAMFGNITVKLFLPCYDIYRFVKFLNNHNIELFVRSPVSDLEALSAAIVSVWHRCFGSAADLTFVQANDFSSVSNFALIPIIEDRQFRVFMHRTDSSDIEGGCVTEIPVDHALIMGPYCPVSKYCTGHYHTYDQLKGLLAAIPSVAAAVVEPSATGGVPVILKFRAAPRIAEILLNATHKINDVYAVIETKPTYRAFSFK